mgnify:CR=1 FL=1
MQLEPTSLVAFVAGLILITLLLRLLLAPLKLIARVIVNGLVGGLILWGVNLAGNYLGFHLPLNPITALIAGFLGIPGVALIAVLKYLLAA